jgi:hypothetical protein
MEPIKKILRTPSAFVLILVAIFSLIGVIWKSNTDKTIARLPIDATATAESRLTEAAKASIPQNTSTPVVFYCKPLLLSERFDKNNNNFKSYLFQEPLEVINGKLRLTMNQTFTGVVFNLPGQYETFSTIEFEAYPVGEISDASVNIVFLKQGDDWYEYQVRPRQHSFQFRRLIYSPDPDQRKVVFEQGWTENPSVGFGEQSMLVRVAIQKGQFSLFINNEFITTITDPNPLLRGEVMVGIGTGEITPITIDIDNIKICGN